MWSIKSKVVVNINGNWIKLFSKFVNWEWYKEQNTKSLYIHCLLKANWKDGKFEGVIVPRGSFITSLDSLSKELGLTIQQVRTALKHLISTNEITSESNNKYRLITIVNYELYQQVNKQLNNQLTSNQQATNKQLTTIEEYKNIDNSVCNNTHAHTRDNVCHLGSLFKEECCFKCMKKRICKLPESSNFKLENKQSFEEWNRDTELLYEQWCKERTSRGESISIELFDYDWLNDNEENDLYES